MCVMYFITQIDNHPVLDRNSVPNEMMVTGIWIVSFPTQLNPTQPSQLITNQFVDKYGNIIGLANKKNE